MPPQKERVDPQALERGDQVSTTFNDERRTFDHLLTDDGAFVLVFADGTSETCAVSETVIRWT